MKQTQVSVDSKWGITYRVVSKTGMPFAVNQGYGMTLSDAIKLREKCTKLFPTISPFTIERRIHTLQKVNVWDELCNKVDTVLSSQLNKYI